MNLTESQKTAYQELNRLLVSATAELTGLCQVTPPGAIRGNIVDYLHTFIILRRSALALLTREDNDE